MLTFFTHQLTTFQFQTLNEANTKSRLKPVSEDPSRYTDYEIIYNPEEWKYVERLMPVKWIPDPTPKEDYPSGWKPQSGRPICMHNFNLYEQSELNLQLSCFI